MDPLFRTIWEEDGQLEEQCTQCGKCSSGCPAARYLELRPRRVALMAQRKMIKELLDSNIMWSCTQCHQCMERCPRKVAPYDIIISLQNIAVRDGLYFPENLSVLSNAVTRRGIIQNPQEIFDREFEGFERETLNLPKLKGPKDITNFQMILKKILEEG